ncbi:hypothetical protein EB796_000932 [Bugula neritina]|uniref:Uncharacterized protein n=1 Tax=Bugula neritina TaxID=10212 RepID=A0A7J7KRJ3_BUGNE|nr:hypothetical protein EB796_000932 [Bugula neritina]
MSVGQIVLQCQPLSDRETSILTEFATDLKVRRAQKISALPVAHSSQSDHGTTSAVANDDLSGLSDDDENLYPDGKEVEEMKFIRLRLNPTSNPKIRQLFSNTDKVITYLMLIFNNSPI